MGKESLMTKLFSRAIVLLAILFTVACTDTLFANGKTLYLERGVETRRAKFVYAQDCQLIAKKMNAAEPRANWYCR